MPLNSDQITVAITGAVSVAPYTSGMTLPTDSTTALANTYTHLGYTTEDGVTFNAEAETEDLMAWQKTTPVRRVTTNRSSSIAFSLMQYNRDTFATAFGGGTWTSTGSAPNVVYRYDPPGDSDALAQYAVIVDFQDGTKKGRLVMTRATINEGVETQLVKNQAAMLPITFSALTPDGASKPWFLLSNDAAFATA